MKGLMIGVTFSLLGLFSLLGSAIYGLVSIFCRNIDHEWIPFLISLVTGVIGLFVYIKVARWYTYRKRDELLTRCTRNIFVGRTRPLAFRL